MFLKTLLFLKLCRYFLYSVDDTQYSFNILSILILKIFSDIFLLFIILDSSHDSLCPFVISNYWVWGNLQECCFCRNSTCPGCRSIFRSQSFFLLPLRGSLWFMYSGVIFNINLLVWAPCITACSVLVCSLNFVNDYFSIHRPDGKPVSLTLP